MAQILIVDDNTINQKVTAIMLQRLGYDVLQAYDGEQALDMLVELKPDVILMDLYMPGLSGTETTKEIRERGIKLPILGISAASSEEEIQDCLDSGMNDTVGKPFTSEVLDEKLKSWLSA